MILAPRYIPRIAATVALFTRYGLLDFAKRQGLTSIEGLGAAEGQPGRDKDIAEAKDKAVAFRERLVELGPAYIKLGQVLSTRPDSVQETEPDSSYGLRSHQPRGSKMRINYWPRLAQLTIPVFIAPLLASVAAAQAGETTISASASSPVIATNGRGEVHVAPDRARLQIAVETRSSSANAAAADNAARLTRTIAAVRAAGIDSAQISTAGYSVATDYDGKGRPSGFVVRNGLRIEVRRIADVGKIIDAALSTGATQVSGVQFLRSNLQDSRRSALSLAVAEARRDAEALAEAAGGTLGKLIYLTSGFVQLPTNLAYQEVVVTMATIPATPIMPGDLTVAAVANARWQFLPRQSP